MFFIPYMYAFFKKLVLTICVAYFENDFDLVVASLSFNSLLRRGIF